MASTILQKWATFRKKDLSNTKIRIKQGPVNVYGYTINNPNAAEEFVQCFDAADIGDVILGTTVSDEPIKIPNGGAVVEGGEEHPLLYFNKGLVIAATTTEGGLTAPVSALSVAFRYK